MPPTSSRMESGERADVIIIGGGPAGSTAGSLLAAAGRRVILFEKEVFPRFHIGESLLPFNMDLLARLGVAKSVEERFVEKWGARLISSDGAVSRYIRFAEGFVPGHPRAFQVLRSEFDEMLLRAAAARGVDVREGVPVTEASCSATEGCSVTVREPGPGGETRQATYRGRFLLDASGRDAFIASKRRYREMMPDLKKGAVFAHYEGVERATGPEGGDIIIVVLRDGWFWMIPLPGARTSVGLVTDAAHLKRGGRTKEELLDDALRRCPAAWSRMTNARRVSEVWSASDYSYECRGIAGDGYLLLGDAAAFIDPIFSTGVWLAMSSGEIAADTLHR
ncbi:MAG TPA: tryptophan 7-halogenase, partial [Candidatus Polarisedimenticolia bacterium]|nr:tryptophan 7-halogenase [Candidatus Polarisedimenticolia bacterium]